VSGKNECPVTTYFPQSQITSCRFPFQLQPVYAVSFEKAGFNQINRVVIPILGLAPKAQRPITRSDPIPEQPNDNLEWGFSDVVLQFFFNPKKDGAWKWG
jgi:hypothetical protein